MSKLPFKDADQIKPWFVEDIAAAVQAGVILGDADGNFRPTELVDRQTLAAVEGRQIQRTLLTVDLAVRRVMERVANSVVQVTRPDGGLGSGSVVSSAGYILTNFHVAGDLAEVKVGWSSPYASSRYYPVTVGVGARVVARDPDHDLTLLKCLDTGTFEPVTFSADWDEEVEVAQARFGASLFVQGSPAGLPGWVSKGIASGVRDIPLGGRIHRLLGFSGPINPGNSGGPAFNAEGKQVGVAVAKLGGETIDDLGFLIPLTAVLPFLRQNGIDPVMA